MVGRLPEPANPQPAPKWKWFPLCALKSDTEQSTVVSQKRTCIDAAELQVCATSRPYLGSCDRRVSTHCCRSTAAPGMSRDCFKRPYRVLSKQMSSLRCCSDSVPLEMGSYFSDEKSTFVTLATLGAEFGAEPVVSGFYSISGASCVSWPICLFTAFWFRPHRSGCAHAVRTPRPPSPFRAELLQLSRRPEKAL